MLKHVLVPVDGSDLSERALDYAVKITEENGKITLLTVLDLPGAVSYELYPVPALDLTADYQQSAQSYLNRLAEALRARNFSVDAEVHTGDPASIIVERAEMLKPEALVMSTHGRTGLTRWIVGSVTQKVLSAAPCPVFVIPPNSKS